MQLELRFREAAASLGHVPTIHVDLLARQHEKALFSPRSHYRIVFNEIGVPLVNIRNLKQAFVHLGEAVEGMPTIFSYTLLMFGFDSTSSVARYGLGSS